MMEKSKGRKKTRQEVEEAEEEAEEGKVAEEGQEGRVVEEKRNEGPWKDSEREKPAGKIRGTRSENEGARTKERTRGREEESESRLEKLRGSIIFSNSMFLSPTYARARML